jgi:hypothetical protein
MHFSAFILIDALTDEIEAEKRAVGEKKAADKTAKKLARNKARKKR